VIAGNQNWFTRIQGTDIDLPSSGRGQRSSERSSARKM